MEVTAVTNRVEVVPKCNLGLALQSAATNHVTGLTGVYLSPLNPKSNASLPGGHNSRFYRVPVVRGRSEDSPTFRALAQSNTLYHLNQRSTGEILLWQSRLRMWFAIGIAFFSILPRAFGVMPGDWRLVLLILPAYLVIVGAIAVVIRRRQKAGPVLLAATIIADLMMIFGTSALVTEPAYYERTLFLSLCSIQLSQFYFGRNAAVTGVIGASIGYLTLTYVARRSGVPLIWQEELWALGSFILASVAFTVVHGNFKERLTRIAQLFERAESGDFSGAFTEVRSFPDSIALLGNSYNRVRLQLAEMVLTDPLSGCLNRRGFDQNLEREVARGSRSGRPIALLAVDIDHFKVINDSFGHDAGDIVIREIGELLRDNARAGDVVGRLGGEEFMLLAPDTDESGARQLADRICNAFRTRSFTGPGQALHITASIGVVTEGPSEEHVAGDLRGRADQALYTAKQNGRNQVCMWTKGMAPFRPSPVGPMRKYSGD